MLKQKVKILTINPDTTIQILYREFAKKYRRKGIDLEQHYLCKSAIPLINNQNVIVLTIETPDFKDQKFLEKLKEYKGTLILTSSKEKNCTKKALLQVEKEYFMKYGERIKINYYKIYQIPIGNRQIPIIIKKAIRHSNS